MALRRLARYPAGRFIPAPAGNISLTSTTTRRGRFIPAPAGNIGVAEPVLRPVHPRACGEHGVEDVLLSPDLGSSPRLRGTYALAPDRPQDGRFIPAPAGNMMTIDRRSFYQTVHPRACGEHPSKFQILLIPVGSSPRLRGTCPAAGQHSRRSRFIPAPAGNITAGAAGCGPAPVHPRACGEHPTRKLGQGHILGSSPRLRGTCVHRASPRHCYRFIPAPAGNMQLLFVKRLPQPVHPRACGEHLPSMRSLLLHRFIPAPAGNMRPAYRDF